MNDSSGNHTYLDTWDVCIDQGYVVPVLFHAAQVLCFLLGAPALLWCLWLSLSGSLSGGFKSTQIFPINLFAVELVFCVEGLLEVISYLLSKNLMLRKVICILYYLAWTCRPLLQSCICVERYLAVVQPVAFLKYRLRKYRVASSTVVWVLSLAYASSQFDDEESAAYVVIIVYCLGVAIISLCCFFVLHVLKQPGPGKVEGGRGGKKKQRTTDPHKMRAFGIVLTNLVIILTSSIPVVVGYATHSSSLYESCNVIPVLLIVNIFSVLVSPLLHLYREGRLPCRIGTETR